MRIPSGVVDQVIYFVAVDATDLKTRETGLSSFTVYRSRNGGTAAAFTTPTVTEVDATNMPGVYKLLLDEDMTIDAGDDSQEMAFHITHTGMAPVTRTIELYRPKITAGETLTVSSGDVGVYEWNNVALATTNPLPNAAPDAPGGLPVSDAGALDLDVLNSNIAAILEDTGTNGVVLAADSVTASALAADAVAEINATVDTALSDIGLHFLVNTALPTSWSANITANSALDYMADDGTAVYDRTTDSLQAIADSVGGGPTAAQIADAVWDEAQADHVAAGSFGEVATEVASILADTGTDGVVIAAGQSVASVSGAVGSVTGNVGGNVTGSVGSISGVTFPTNFSALVISAGGAVDSLVQGFLNNTIAETTADNIAANFETFWDNGNALTSKIVNDVGVAGSGLTAQQVWEYNISAIATAGYAGTVLNARASQTSVDTIDGIVDSILADTGTDGVVIAAGQSVASVTGAVGSVTGNVGGSVASVTGNVGGNVSGSVASVTGTVGGIAGTITTLDALDTAQDTQHSTTQSAISALNNLSAADVNAQVVDALATDTYAEPGAVPAATASLADKIGWVYTVSRNKLTQTATTTAVRNDADGANIATATVSDDGTTFTRSEFS